MANIFDYDITKKGYRYFAMLPYYPLNSYRDIDLDANERQKSSANMEI